jgi:diguanylate cyclase (GGDEF)-like protein/PAS domain S-box-containing protein
MLTETDVILVETHLLELAPDAMLVVDRSGRILQANNLAERLFGYPQDSLAGQSLEILVPVRVRDRHQQHLINHLRNPQPRAMDANPILWGLRQDGREFAAQISLNHLATPTGIHLLVAIRDVTESLCAQEALEQASAELERQVEARTAELREQMAERTRAESALRETELLYRRLIESQPDLICRFLPDTTLTFVNRAYARFFGRRPEELIGQRFLELLPATEQAEVLAQLASLTPASPERQCEHPTPRADGVPRWHLWHDFAFFDEHGKVSRFQSVGVDITERKQAEEALRRSETNLQQAQAVAHIGSWHLDVRSNRLDWSAESYRIFGIPVGSPLTYERFLECVPAEDRTRVDTAWKAALSGAPYTIEHRIQVNDEIRWVVEHAEVELDDQGIPLSGTGTVQDITERKRAEDALFEEQERAQVTLDSIGDAVITTDAQGIVSYMNPVAEVLTGWTSAEARDRPLGDIYRIVEEQSRTPAPDPLARCLLEGATPEMSDHLLLLGRDGRECHIAETAAPIRGREGQVLGAVLVFHDVTEPRRLARQLEHDAAHDALTGLINRREFERRLERALGSARQYGAHHALCYLDLDQFKIVNDTAGHAAGDALLRQINGILSGMFREHDTLARIGGDEFGLLLDNCPLDHAQAIAEALVARIREHRFQWDGRTYRIGVSVGLVPIDAKTHDTAQVLTQADAACYQAKQLGRNRVHIYDRAHAEALQRHGDILGAVGLRKALEQGRFRLHYQPIVPLKRFDRQPMRYEVLLRLAHQDSPDDAGELVLPQAFIPVAERLGLMGAIDRWVIRTAFRAHAAGIGNTGSKIAINLSADSLGDETLLGFIEDQLVEHAVPAQQVCFEMTESAAIHDMRGAVDLMSKLKRHGSQLALDDFGSGLSSFHDLKALPIDYLKIDGSFVEDMIENAADGDLVAAINQMSHTLRIETIAEFTHSQEIVTRLRELGVDYAQGYFFGQPTPWAERTWQGRQCHDPGDAL